MTEGAQADKRRQAWGESIASSPQLRALMEQARDELDTGIAEADVRSNTLGRAQEQALAGVRILFPGISRKVLRAPAPVAVRILADYFARKWRGKNVRDAVACMTSALSWDAWLVDFIMNWAKTGEPGPVLDGFLGGVYCGRVGPKGEQSPLVVLVAGPMSDLDALIGDLRRIYEEKMPTARSRSIHRPETWARWCRLFAEGQTDRQIALGELEGRYFLDEEEEKEELRLMIGRVKSDRKRWRDQVTETFPKR